MNKSKYSNERKQIYISINEFSKEIESKNKQDSKIYHPRPRRSLDLGFPVQTRKGFMVWVVKKAYSICRDNANFNEDNTSLFVSLSHSSVPLDITNTTKTIAMKEHGYW